MICAVSLKTEYMTNPMGIDSGKQRLSWKVQGAKKQSACQIRLRVNEGEWIERAPVNSDRMRVLLKMPLSSRDRVCWQVCLTDENGETGPWSESAIFEMGLLERSDWKFRKSSTRYTPEERLGLAREFLETHSYLTVSDYAALTGLLRNAAAKELRRWAEDETSGIGRSGRGTHRVYVRRVVPAE